MNSFNKLYEELLEAMDRRQFLKMMGKGASVAGVAPGAVGKMAMNLATGSAPIDINKTIIDFLNLTYDGKTFIDLGPSKSLDLIRNSLSTLYSFIIKNKLPINDRFTVKEVKHALKELDPANIKKVMDEDNMTIDDFFQNFSEQGRDIDGFDGMLRVLFQHNLINKEAQEVIAHHTGSHWYDYVDTPEAKKIRDEIEAGHRRNFHQYQQQQTAKDINYSRMDTAGGSEDVGYSKYDESIKHILEAMDRRQFLKMMGKGAQAAAGASIAPKGAAGGIVGSLIKTTAGSPITQAVKTIFDPKSVNLFIDDKIALNYVSAMKNAILALTPVVGSKSAQISVKTLDEILSGKLYGSDLGDFIEDTELGNLIHFSIITNLYKQNLITPELEKWMFLESNLDPYHLMRLKLYSINLTEPKAVDVKAALNKNYPDWRELSDKKMFGSLDPETEKRLKSSNNRAVERWDKKSAEELKRWEEQDYKDHLGAIRSRMDYAGGSEDVDYAQTFEKFFIENYADGKKPGRKGLAKRSGVNCKQSVSKLRKVAKNSSGERRRMAHWCANMKAGKKKKK